jgi:hypothetical protein
VIYSIPPISPLHYVTYVRIYNSNPDFVYVGYTPGYYGTIVGADGTVVYGTGYAYPAYVGADDWYPPFITYGWGCDPCWTPWWGWSFEFGFGWGYRHFWSFPPAPCWGPFFVWEHHFHHGFRTWEVSTSVNAFHRAGLHTISTTDRAARWSRYGQAYNSRTGILATGNQRAGTNVFNGTPLPGARGFAVEKPGKSGNNVYGTKSGHVYSFEQNKIGGQWRQMNAKSAPAGTPNWNDIRGLNRQRFSRAVGNHRATSFRRYSPPAASPSESETPMNFRGGYEGSGNGGESSNPHGHRGR